MRNVKLLELNGRYPPKHIVLMRCTVRNLTSPAVEEEQAQLNITVGHNLPGRSKWDARMTRDLSEHDLERLYVLRRLARSISNARSSHSSG